MSLKLSNFLENSTDTSVHYFKQNIRSKKLETMDKSA
jgi:hypothetical protein